MQKLLVGLLIGAAVGVAVGYALFNKQAEEPAKADTVESDRGEWPEVPSPPQAQAGEPMMMASQRLAEILGKAPPPHIVPMVMACWMEVHTPETWPPRSEAVFRAWTAANTMPPDWPAVAKELEPDR